MKTRIRSAVFSMFLCIALVFTLMPAASYAADPVNYNLWVGSTRVTSDTMSGEGWSYQGDGSKGTLTLKNANITGRYAFNPFSPWYANIYSNDIELTIRLEGNNTISAEGQSKTDGIRTSGKKLTITGSGSLEIKPSEYAIYTDGLVFDNTTVRMSGGYRAIEINGNNDVEINGGKVEMTNDSYGLSCGILRTSSNAELTVKTSRTGLGLDGAVIRDSVLTIETGSDDAIYADDDDVMIENSVVSAKSRGSIAIDCYSDNCNLVITDSKVTASCNSFAIWANSINIKDGSGSTTTYVEATTTSTDKPAVYSVTENGITLGDGIGITEPEEGTFGSFTYIDNTGTTVNNQSGEIAKHVIISGLPKPEPEPTPAPQPSPVISKNPLIASMTAKGKTSLAIKWNRIAGAAGYDVFFSQCDSNSEKKVVALAGTVTGGDHTAWNASGLKAKTAYKACVKAWIMKDGTKTYVKTSPLIHAYTSGGNKKFTNAKSVSVKKAKVSLKKGKTFKIKASVKKLKKSKKLMPTSHAAKLRYLSTNAAVAKVSKSGKIKATGKGTCYIYAYAQNGVYKRVKVTVK